jgi:hypothetical protein
MAVNPADILLSLAKIAKAIYDQVQLAKANQAQCQILSNRVAIVMESVQGLGKLKDSAQYRPMPG